MNSIRQRQHGFTLVEMAIVMVIIGLVAGGIMVGAGMIRQAEVNSVGEDFLTYETAINHFIDMYDALPGDYARATDQWGVVAGIGNDETCYATETPGSSKATCNGNDNNHLGSGCVPGAWCDENDRVWQHLANADLIAGSYSGSRVSRLGGRDAPKARLSNAVIAVADFDDAFNNAYGAHDFFLVVIKESANISGASSYFPGILTPEEALSFDIKFDDGHPNLGVIRANNPHGTAPGCTDDSAASGVYLVASNERECIVARKFKSRKGINGVSG